MLDNLKKIITSSKVVEWLKKPPVVVSKSSFTHDQILKDLINDEHSHMILENKKDELIMLHHSLGRRIRNDYGLWNHPHTPEIVDGVDVSPTHPDYISQRIIEKLYEYWETHTEELTKRKNQVS